MESEPKNDESLPDLKKTVAFRQVLSEAGKAFDFYHLGLKDLPALSHGSIKFVSAEELHQQVKRATLATRDNLLISSPLSLGVEEKDIYPTQSQELVFVNYFESLKIIYFPRESFVGLDSQSTAELFRASIALGGQLIAINLNLLPEPVKIDPKPWLPSIKEGIDEFLMEYADKINPQRQEEFEILRGNFAHFVEADPSFNVLASGAEIIATMGMGQKVGEQPLVKLAPEFNRKVILYLSYPLQRQFITSFIESIKGLALRGQYRALLEKGMEEMELGGRLYSFSMNLDKSLERFKDGILNDLRVSLVKAGVLSGDFEDLLKRLELDAYQPLFEAYRQSLIPQVFLERQEMEKRLRGKNPKRQRPELVYPLD